MNHLCTSWFAGCTNSIMFELDFSLPATSNMHVLLAKKKKLLSTHTHWSVWSTTPYFLYLIRPMNGRLAPLIRYLLVYDCITCWIYGRYCHNNSWMALSINQQRKFCWSMGKCRNHLNCIPWLKKQLAQTVGGTVSVTKLLCVRIHHLGKSICWKQMFHDVNSPCLLQLLHIAMEKVSIYGWYNDISIFTS